MSVNPLQFKTTIPPDQLVINHEPGIDLLWLEETQVFHVVDTHTGFRNATVLRGKRGEDVWSSFVECWKNLYTSHPNIIRLVRETGIASKSFRDTATVTELLYNYQGLNHKTSSERKKSITNH